MGWLRDFMNGAEPPIPSFGRLAGSCLNHPDWPTAICPKPRSLSTLFSKLDRGQDLDWLRDRVEVQQVLAQLLGRPMGSLREAIGETPYSSDSRFLRLRDIRYARDVDLARESLPPGIPSEVLHPPEWRPTWWHAPPGAGRSISAQWLAARGLAHTVAIEQLSDLEKLPSRGALYLDVASGFDAPSIEVGPAFLERLRPFARPVLIAAPFLPQRDTVFEVLETPHVREHLPELVDWVASRLDVDGHFHADKAEQWMRRVASTAFADFALGDALGLLGMLDEVHPKTLVGKSIDELGAHFVRSRIREVSEHLPHGPRGAEMAYDTLKACAARMLVEGARSLAGTYTLDEWTAHFSTPKNDSLPDPEWFTDALRGALGNHISRRDLRRAASKLEPGAFQLARGMEAAGLLARPVTLSTTDTATVSRRLHPRWLVRLLNARAFEEVLSFSANAWGKVLFEGRDADRLMEALLAQGRAGQFRCIFQLVDEFEEESSEHVAALEASMIVCGMLLLEGQEVPDDLQAAVVEHTMATLIVLDGLPHPRLTLDASQAKLFNSDWWLISLATCAVQAPLMLRHLDPLRSESRPLLDHYARAVRKGLDLEDLALRPSVARGVSLLDLLVRMTESSERRPAVVHLLEGGLERATLDLIELARKECQLDIVLSYCVAKGEDQNGSLRTLWRLVAFEEQPDRIFSTPKMKSNLWEVIPLDILDERVRRGLPTRFTALLPHQFDAWLDRQKVFDLPAEAARLCPLDALLSRLHQHGPGAFSEATLGVVIERAGARAGLMLNALLEAGDVSRLASFVNAIPPSAIEELLGVLPPDRQMLHLRPAALSLLRRFLLRVVRKRHPGFETANELLFSLETNLTSLRALPQ